LSPAKVFIHPDDDARFDDTPLLKSEDRDWIAARDQETEQSAKPITEKPSALASERFVVLDPEWQCVRVEKDVFNLRNREQIKKVLQFLYYKGYTSATGKRVSVKKVCQAAGQEAKKPNLHAIFHVMKQPADSAFDYDKLYDKAIDCQRNQGVWLKV
jgi:hypothetical protein